MRTTARLAAAMATTILVIGVSASCGSDETPVADEPASAATGDDREFPGGETLATYQDSPSYPWRVNILDNQDELIEALQEVAGDLGETDFGDIVRTCDDLSRGLDGNDLVGGVVERFSRDQEQLEAAQGLSLIEISEQYACP